MKGKILTIVAICILLSLFQFKSPYGSSYTLEGELYPLMEPHGHISINNSIEFVNMASAEVWPGSGTPGDPIIISGYQIDAEGGPFGIYIANTTINFVLRGCSVNNTRYVSEPYNVGAGVHLHNVSNCTVSDVEVSNCDVGILYNVGEGDLEVTGCRVFDNNAGGFTGYCHRVMNVSMTNNIFINNSCSGDPCEPGGGVRLFGWNNTTAVVNVRATGNTIDNNGTSGGLFRVGDFGEGDPAVYGRYVPFEVNVTLMDNHIIGGEGGGLKLLALSKLSLYAENNTILNGGSCSNRIGYNPGGYFVKDLECVLKENILGRNNSEHWGDSWKIMAENEVEASIQDNRISNTSFGSLRIGWACGEIGVYSGIVDADIKGNNITDCRGGGISVMAKDKLDTKISSNYLDNITEGYPGGGYRSGIEVVGLNNCRVNADIRYNTVNNSLNNGILLAGGDLPARGMVANNRISRGHPMNLDHVGIELNNTIGTPVMRNTITHFAGAGIRVLDSYSSRIVENLIHNTSVNHTDPREIFGAIVLDNTNGTEVRHNRIVNSSFGINLFGYSSENSVLNNTLEIFFVGTIFQIQSDNNTARNNTYNGGYVGMLPGYGSSNNTVSGNHVSETTVGIYSIFSNDITIEGCEVHGSEMFGISVIENRGAAVSDNRVFNTSRGVNIERCWDSEIQNNTIVDQDRGIYVESSVGISLTGNTVINSSMEGIDLFQTDRSRIARNLIRDSTGYGIRLLESNDNELFENAFLFNNGTGKEYNGSISQAFDDLAANRWNLSGEGNYWLDLTNPDSDGDGVVDDPYSIPDNDSAADERPLVYSPISPSPVNVTASPGDGSVVLEWTLPQLRAGWAVEEVIIYRESPSRSPDLLITLEGPATEYVDDTAENGMEYHYQVSLFTTAGEGEPSDPVTVEPDGIPPSISILSPTDGVYLNTDDVTMEWEGSDPSSGIDHYEVRLQSDSSYTDVGMNTSYVFNNLTGGTHTTWLRCYDRAGNQNETSVSFTVDITLPEINIITPRNGSYLSTTTVNVTWNISDGGSGIASLSILLDDGAPQDVSGEIFREFDNLPQGIHVVELIAEDRAGNVNVTDISFQVDTIPPEAEILIPVEGELFDSGRGINISWTGSDGGSGIQRFFLRLDDGTWMDMGSTPGYYVHDEDFSEGNHTITLSCEDLASNRGEDSLTFEVDGTPPEVLDHGPTGEDVPPDSSIFVNFSEKMSVDEVDLEISGVEGSINWTGNRLDFDPTDPLEDGVEYTVTVSGRDLAGNGMEPFQWSFRTSGDLVELTGRVVDLDDLILPGVRVEVLDENITDTTDDSGLFSFLLEPGKYRIRLSAEGYVNLTVKVDLGSGSDMDLGDIALQELTGEKGVITGRVIDSEGVPVQGADVYLDGLKMTATDSNGFFILYEVDEGTHDLRIEKDGYETFESEVEVRPDKQKNIGDVELEDERFLGIPGLMWLFTGLILLALILIVVIVLVIKSGGKEEEESWEGWEE